MIHKTKYNKFARPSRVRGLAILHVFAFLIASLFVLYPTQSSAQWKSLPVWCLQGASPDVFTDIYFLDLPGAPRVGFVGTFDTGARYSIEKTTDGGNSWKRVLLADNVEEPALDIVFKDSMTGWVAMGNGICKTTDQGETWNYLTNTSTINSFSAVQALYYNKTTRTLFLGGDFYTGNGIAISSDDGSSWIPEKSTSSEAYDGFAFNNDTIGIISMNLIPLAPWLRTTDAGKTWERIAIDSIVWQPYAIPGTSTEVAITQFGNVLRSTDTGTTWKVIYTFSDVTPDARWGFTNSSCMRGDGSRLFIGNKIGCYLSTDLGESWKYLCGQPSDYSMLNTRFYVKGGYVYIATNDSVSGITNLWMLDVDSMQYFRTRIAFPDSSKRTTAIVGNDVTVNFFPEANDPIGIDSGHIVIQFDTSSLNLKNLKLPSSWTIVDSSTTGGLLDLWIKDASASQLPTPIIQMTFGTALGSLSPKVFLDSAHLFGKRLNCDCQAISLAPPDSVEIDFASCGDSIILAAMHHQLPFTIQSITPNPTASNLSVTLATSTNEQIHYELYDALGKTELQGSLPNSTSTLDLHTLPSGSYYLRLSTQGQTESRRIVLER